MKDKYFKPAVFQAFFRLYGVNNSCDEQTKICFCPQCVFHILSIKLQWWSIQSTCRIMKRQIEQGRCHLSKKSLSWTASMKIVSFMTKSIIIIIFFQVSCLICIKRKNGVLNYSGQNERVNWFGLLCGWQT